MGEKWSRPTAIGRVKPQASALLKIDGGVTFTIDLAGSQISPTTVQHNTK